MKDSYKKTLEIFFEFLIKEYECSLLSRESDSEYYKLLYKNQTTGVKITYEYKEANIFVQLYRLINGTFVEDKSPIANDPPLHSMDLNYIVQLRDAKAVTRPL